MWTLRTPLMPGWQLFRFAVSKPLSYNAIFPLRRPRGPQFLPAFAAKRNGGALHENVARIERSEIRGRPNNTGRRAESVSAPPRMSLALHPGYALSKGRHRRVLSSSG